MAVTNNQDVYLKNNAAMAQAAANSNPYQGMTGLSDTTRQNMAKYQEGYKPSQTVTEYQQRLKDVEAQKPKAYESKYQQQLDDLWNQINNRGSFKYDFNEDPMFQQYSQMYQQKGKQAMMDTMGQAAALTGGYGNSYAQQAGQQAYQNSLMDLYAIMPQMRQQALSEWQQAGADLENRWKIGSQAEETAYSKYRDTVSDWERERAYAADQYQNERTFDYGQYGDARDYWAKLAESENGDFWTQRNYALENIKKIVANGQMPSDALIAQAGLTADDVRKMIIEKSKGGGGGSGGSGGTQPASSSKTTSTGTPTPQQAATDLLWKNIQSYKNTGLNLYQNYVKQQSQKNKTTSKSTNTLNLPSWAWVLQK